MVCFCKGEVGKIFKLNLVLNCKLNTRKSSKVSTTPHQSYTTSSNTGGWVATELTYVQPHTTLTSEKINKSGTAVMSQTEYYFQIPNFGLFTGYMTNILHMLICWNLICHGRNITIVPLEDKLLYYVYYYAPRDQSVCPITCHVKGRTSNMKMTQLGKTLMF